MTDAVRTKVEKLANTDDLHGSTSMCVARHRALSVPAADAGTVVAELWVMRRVGIDCLWFIGDPTAVFGR
ncbi:hypothetical protein [Streptosporangium canum]|uniref:hypothetical protein n=1 Tax=Streptosporangium canum TaxID=324952 RepID=UPI00378DB121